MSWTRLRESGFSGWLLLPAATGAEDNRRGLGFLRPGMTKLLPYAALTAAAGSVIGASLVAAPGAPGFFGAGLGLLMIAVAVADARAFRIPDRLTLPAFLLALASTSAKGFENMGGEVAQALTRGIVLALAFFALREIYFRLRQRQGIGLGDVKLAAVAGAWLDFTLIPAAIEMATVLALIFYLANQRLLRQPLRASAKLPFGLFFAPAIWFCWLIGALFLQD